MVVKERKWKGIKGKQKRKRRNEKKTKEKKAKQTRKTREENKSTKCWEYLVAFVPYFLLHALVLSVRFVLADKVLRLFGCVCSILLLHTCFCFHTFCFGWQSVETIWLHLFHPFVAYLLLLSPFCFCSVSPVWFCSFVFTLLFSHFL